MRQKSARVEHRQPGSFEFLQDEDRQRPNSKSVCAARPRGVEMIFAWVSGEPRGQAASMVVRSLFSSLLTGLNYPST